MLDSLSTEVLITRAIHLTKEYQIITVMNGDIGSLLPKFQAESFLK